MNIYIAAILFAFIILLYWVISELFTVLFRFTGLPEEKARYQVTSLLTGCGFTTRESEMIISSRRRRRMARITMLFGYVFNITIVSALVNIFISLKVTQLGASLGSVAILLGALAVIFVFIRVPAVHSWGSNLMKRLAGHFVQGELTNSVLLLDYIGRDSIAQIDLYKVPEAFQGVPLSQTGLKNDNNILVMLVEKQGGKAVPATADTVFQEDDHLTVFGDYNTICRVFEARERFADETEEAAEPAQKPAVKTRKPFE